MWSSITFSDYLIVGGILLVACYLYFTWPFDYFAKRNVKFKKPVPIFGNAIPLVTSKKSFAEMSLELYNEFKGYSISGTFQFINPMFILRDPELIKLIMVKDFEHFMDRTEYIPNNADTLFSANLVELKGERWRRMKSILSPAFTSSKMKGMFPFISKCGQQLVNHLESLIQKSGDGILEIEMKDLFTKYTNDVIATSAFGICCDSLKNPNNEFYLCGKDITSCSLLTLFSMIGYLLFPKLMALLKIKFISTKSANFLYNAVRETIRTREENGIVRPDMIHLLLQARKEELNEDLNDTISRRTDDKKNIKFSLTETDITAQVMIFFFEGFEMPATVLSFASLLLAMHQDIQERLQEEIDQTLEECGGNITYDTLHNMKYLDMVFSETLRMYPPEVVAERQCTKPYTIQATSNTPAVRLNIKDRVLIPIYAIHHDPLYYPDPEKFDPERFNETNKRNIKPYTYLPFGSGPRGCIGTRFALMENKLALVYLLSKFTLQIIDKSAVPIKFQANNYLLVPDKGFWIGIRLRKMTD